MGLFDFFKNKIDINEAVAGLKDVPGAVLVDVREPMEYAADADSLLIDLKAHPKRYVHFSVFGKKDKAK